MSNESPFLNLQTTPIYPNSYSTCPVVKLYMSNKLCILKTESKFCFPPPISPGFPIACKRISSWTRRDLSPALILSLSLSLSPPMSNLALSAAHFTCKYLSILYVPVQSITSATVPRKIQKLASFSPYTLSLFSTFPTMKPKTVNGKCFFSFLIFKQVWHNKLHIFKFYNLIYFDICIMSEMIETIIEMDTPHKIFLCPLYTSSYSLSIPFAPGSCWAAFFHYKSGFSRIVYKWNHAVYSLFCLALLT